MEHCLLEVSTMTEAVSQRSCKIRVSAATDRGRVREGNEDAFTVFSVGGEAVAFAEATVAELNASAQPVMLAVSDGMGGAAAGDVASALTIESLQRALVARGEVRRADWESVLESAIQRANSVVREAAQDPRRRGMGATLTAICVDGHDAHVAEVGDSRAYLLRNGTLTQLTKDQSFVQALVDAGVMTEAEAEHSPKKNIILNAMGTKPDVRAVLGRLRLLAGDVLLVCSDGLTNELTSEVITGLLTASPAPDEACIALVNAANEMGGHDNITVVVASIG